MERPGEAWPLARAVREGFMVWGRGSVLGAESRAAYTGSRLLLQNQQESTGVFLKPEVGG